MMTRSFLQATRSHPRSWALPKGLTWGGLTLALILVASAGVRLVHPASFGDANSYYTAAVDNMLQSASNFFFVSADAGGVTVDKPPVALWIQATFAAVLGVSGFAVILPSIIAGVLSVLVLYYLVKRWFGQVAGLIAAWVLALTPITVAVDRTNNPDSLLILTLLLATWAVMHAIESGKGRYLVLGAVLVGVGFNIKMLQAYLILPALYGVYLMGADVALWRKIAWLGLASVVLVIVSLSWAVAVDLTPADERPYVGNSQDNSVLELALGYNGLQRLLGHDAPHGNNNTAAPAPNGRGGGVSNEVGQEGATRLFESELANELSWLLPFGLLSVGLMAARRLRWPLEHEHQALVLWGGWLVSGVVFFSISGFFHAYYLATLAPALAACVGIGAVLLWDWVHRYGGLGLMVAFIFLAVTVTFQLYAISYYMLTTTTLLLTVGAVVALGLIAWGLDGYRLGAVAFVVTLLLIPTWWGGLTAWHSTNDTPLPAAYAAETTHDAGSNRDRGAALAPLANYITAQNPQTTYDLMVESSMVGSSVVLTSDLDVLYLGGFSGRDAIYSVEDFAAMVEEGQVGYVFGLPTRNGIGAWVAQACQTVDVEGLAGLNVGRPPGPPPDRGNGGPPPDGNFGGGPPPGMGNSTSLYDCTTAG